MIHPLNGRRASEWDRKQSLVAIVCLPLNSVFQPLDAIPTAPPSHFIRPLQQVALRTDKFSELGYLRLGETPGDEANCWISPANIEIVEVLGAAREVAGAWKCEPLEADDVRKAA